MVNILLLGANGQLGQAFQDLSKTESFPIGWTLTAWGRKQFDLSLAETQPDLLLQKLSALHPDVILNTAAYTAVDLAEKERELCEAINARAPALLSDYCKAAGIPLVHYSTDYVYAGVGTAERTESESHAPQNFYGQSKAQGDEAVMSRSGDYLIFRTSWVFSHVGKNFVKTMLKLGRERPELKIVNDQVGAPSYAPDLAMYSLDALMQALERKEAGTGFPSGVYHLTNSGAISWAQFAESILPGKTIIGIPSSEYPTPAVRPLNSRLNLQKFSDTFGIRPRPWQEALAECIAQLKEPIA